MSSTKPVNKNSPISPIVIGVLFSTYFLTVQTIEYSLSNYVLNENQVELYRKYLLFKGNSSIWHWWHLLSLLTIPLAVFEACSDLVRIFTKKYPLKRTLMSIIRAIQLFSTLFISFGHTVSLEKKFIETNSKDILVELNYYQSLLFLLNIIAWFIPIIQYKQAQENPEPIHEKKKSQ
ncbi:hypothetical protein I4U23_006060 [Adineta vaga]|nr:hypothetical protein I4U23_006060 [Adineta vaga]